MNSMNFSCCTSIVTLLFVAVLVTICNARIQIKAFGSIQSTAYYYTDIYLGKPELQRQSVILDTGSNLLAFPCSSCNSCGTHIDSYYNEKLSIANKKIPCTTDCESCSVDRSQCTYNIHYLEGSSLSGSFYQDFLALKNYGDNMPRVVGLQTVFGCVTLESHLFATQAASGILGLSYSAGRSGQPSFMQSWSKNTNAFSELVLSICFSQDGGILSFGGYNSEYWADNENNQNLRQYPNSSAQLTWTPMNIIKGNYYVKLYDMRVNEAFLMKNLKSPIRFVVDSGTTLTYFPSEIYRGIWDEISKSVKNRDKRSNSWRQLLLDGWNYITNNKEKRVGIEFVELSSSLSASHRKRIPYSFSLKKRSMMAESPSALENSYSDSRLLIETDHSEKCWKFLDFNNDIKSFPSIKFIFDGNYTVFWHPKQYLYRKYHSTYCLSFDSDESFFVLGSSFFINKDVILDIGFNRATFVDANCPSFIFSDRESASEVNQLFTNSAVPSFNGVIYH